MSENRLSIQNLQNFKETRRKEIIDFLREDKINLEIKVSFSEISNFLDIMVILFINLTYLERLEENIMIK